MNNQKLTSKMIRNCFQVLLFFYGVVIIIAIIANSISSSRTWYGNEPFFDALKFLSDHALFIITIILLVGTLLIVVKYWLKTLNYMETIVSKTKTIYDVNEAAIELSPELFEVEKQLNDVKYNIRENQRLAKEAEQRKNDLVVYLAHDLKTPLTSIIGYLTLLHDEPDISVATRERYLNITVEKSLRLEELINEFFEITRFNLSQLSLEPRSINLTRMLEQIVFEFNPLFLERQLECQLMIEPDLHIKIDVNKMYRVFDNLLKNAINYSYESTRIDFLVTKESDTIKFKIINHGPTIPKEKIERIFEQFYRLDTSRGTRSGGAGLGLAITKKIIELHQGTIRVSSEAEIITFEFDLPAS